VNTRGASPEAEETTRRRAASASRPTCLIMFTLEKDNADGYHQG
jgi:hypothetical protein